MNAVAIILHLVSRVRENRRKGFGASYADFKHCGVSVDVLPCDHITVKPE